MQYALFIKKKLTFSSVYKIYKIDGASCANSRYFTYHCPHSIIKTNGYTIIRNEVPLASVEKYIRSSNRPIEKNNNNKFGKKLNPSELLKEIPLLFYNKKNETNQFKINAFLMSCRSSRLIASDTFICSFKIMPKIVNVCFGSLHKKKQQKQCTKSNHCYNNVPDIKTPLFLFTDIVVNQK